jgi:hypothetical protein
VRPGPARPYFEIPLIEVTLMRYARYEFFSP